METYQTWSFQFCKVETCINRGVVGAQRRDRVGRIASHTLRKREAWGIEVWRKRNRTIPTMLGRYYDIEPELKSGHITFLAPILLLDNVNI